MLYYIFKLMGYKKNLHYVKSKLKYPSQLYNLSQAEIYISQLIYHFIHKVNHCTYTNVYTHFSITIGISILIYL